MVQCFLSLAVSKSSRIVSCTVQLVPRAKFHRLIFIVKSIQVSILSCQLVYAPRCWQCRHEPHWGNICRAFICYFFRVLTQFWLMPFGRECGYLSRHVMDHMMWSTTKVSHHMMWYYNKAVWTSKIHQTETKKWQHWKNPMKIIRIHCG